MSVDRTCVSLEHLLECPDELLLRLRTDARRRHYQARVLGYAHQEPVLFLEPADTTRGKPRLLVAAGFHGDEPAGPLAILRALSDLPGELFDQASVSFLPLVNPTGFRNHRRTNVLGEDPNRGYCHPELGTRPSAEGQVLLDHLPRLISAARDGFLSLHEDWEETRMYLYTSEPSPPAGGLAAALRDRGACHFSLLNDGTVGGAPVSEGILYQDCDGSLEDLFSHSGVPTSVCTETPGHAPIDERVVCDLDLMQTAIRLLEPSCAARSRISVA